MPFLDLRRNDLLFGLLQTQPMSSRYTRSLQPISRLPHQQSQPIGSRHTSNLSQSEATKHPPQPIRSHTPTSANQKPSHTHLSQSEAATLTSARCCCCRAATRVRSCVTSLPELRTRSCCSNSFGPPTVFSVFSSSCTLFICRGSALSLC